MSASSGSSSSSSDSPNARSTLSTIASAMNNIVKSSVTTVFRTISGAMSPSSPPQSQSQSSSGSSSSSSLAVEPPSSLPNEEDRTDTATAPVIPDSPSSAPPSIPSDVPQISFSDLDLDRSPSARLGSGTFGSVFKCKYRNPTTKQEIEVAVKIIDASEQLPQQLLEIEREIAALWRLRHCPQVVQLIGMVQQDTINYEIVRTFTSDASKVVMLVMELCSKSLRALMFDSTRLCPQPAQWPLWMQLRLIIPIGEGILHAHQVQPAPILHRDLKLGNILVKGPGLQIRVADFGLSKISAEASSNRFGAVGTPGYRCPEFFSSRIPVKYQFHHDVYSFGIIIWSIATRQFVNGPEMERKEPEIPSSVDSRLADIMRRCWQYTERPQLGPILQSLRELQQCVAANEDLSHVLMRWPQDAGQSLYPPALRAQPNLAREASARIHKKANETSERLDAADRYLERKIYALTEFEKTVQEQENKAVEETRKRFRTRDRSRSPPSPIEEQTAVDRASAEFKSLQKQIRFERRALKRQRLELRTISQSAKELSDTIEKEMKEASSAKQIEMLEDTSAQVESKAHMILADLQFSGNFEAQSPSPRDYLGQFIEHLEEILDMANMPPLPEFSMSPREENKDNKENEDQAAGREQSTPLSSRSEGGKWIYFRSPTSLTSGSNDAIVVYHTKSKCHAMQSGERVIFSQAEAEQLEKVGNNNELMKRLRMRRCLNCRAPASPLRGISADLEAAAEIGPGN